MNWSMVGSIIVGSVPGVLAVAALMLRIDQKLSVFLVEHEMLMGWYAKEHNISLKDLPTRSRHTG